MNRRVAVFLVAGFVGVFLLLAVSAVSFIIGAGHRGKSAGPAPKLKNESADRTLARKPVNRTRSRPIAQPVIEEDFPNSIDVTNWSQIAPVQTIEEMRLRAET